MNRSHDAYVLVADGRMNCAQAVLSVYCEKFGLERNLALKLAQGFGGGMGRSGKTCGAVTGAYMVLGLAHKMSSDSPGESRDRMYTLVQEFNQKFREIHGSVTCKELIGYDLSSPEGLSEARDKKVFTVVCPKLVETSVKILENILPQK